MQRSQSPVELLVKVGAQMQVPLPVRPALHEEWLLQAGQAVQFAP